MKRLFFFILSISMLFSLTACGGDNQKMANYTPAATTTPASTTPAVITDDDVLNTFWELRQQARQAAKNHDYNAFSALFTESNLDDLCNVYEAWSKESDIFDLYDQHYGIVLGEKDGYYHISCSYGIVGGTSSNPKRESVGEFCVMKKTDDLWKLTLKDIDLSLIYERLPEEAQAARKNNRNLVIFTDLLGACFLDTNIYYKDDFTASAVYAWQDADGGVNVAVHISNGTNINRVAQNIHTKLTDTVMGTIADVVAVDDYVIPAYSSRIITIYISPKDVQTGTYAWGSVGANLGWD